MFFCTPCKACLGGTEGVGGWMGVGVSGDEGVGLKYLVRVRGDRRLSSELGVNACPNPCFGRESPCVRLTY